jgi:hypothetical protein
MTLGMSCGVCAGESSNSQHPTATPEVLEHPPPEAAVTEELSLEDVEIFPVDERMFIREGLEDLTNRYSFTVMLTATIAEGETRRCSGAVIAPHLILTAAHCVCIRSKTGMNCAKRATVTTVLYDPSKGVMENLLGSRHEGHDGTVRAHPNFKSSSNDQEIDSASPDLALVILDQPVASWIRPVRLALDELPPGESVIIVGYGQDETSDLTLGFRRFGKKKVTAFRHGRGILEQQGLVALSSEGGAPCLREHGREAVLVGLISVYSDEAPTFTNVHPHQEWLRSELRQAASPNIKDFTP